ncbi:MAG TPA: hypothetical protein VMW87_16150 [Spirochaetia bacterium]|nr:hypothetical protein [Spirochaetia bacterium]
MRVRSKVRNLCIRALTGSLDTNTLVHLIRRMFQNYDLNERTGFPDSIPIPMQNAARQIVEDCINSGRFLEFVALLIEVDRNGIMGRAYRIRDLQDIIEEVVDLGFLYDAERRVFVEDAGQQRTKNWGLLREGDEYLFTFLRMDIVGNSNLVRSYEGDVIAHTYSDLRSIVQRIVENRNGRIWSWEGDGGVCAFHGAGASNPATLCAMEILHEIFLYNMLECPLMEPVMVRLAVHNGTCEYHEVFEEINAEVIKKLADIESRFTEPNSVTISKTAHSTLDAAITAYLRAFQPDARNSLYRYALEFKS